MQQESVTEKVESFLLRNNLLGKTFVVGKKVVKYLERWEYNYRGLAVLSFTNVASDEIVKQVNEISKTSFSSLTICICISSSFFN